MPAAVPVATQPAAVEPYRYVSRAEVEPPKKKHRIVGVALTTVVSLMIVSYGWNAMDRAAHSGGGGGSPATSPARPDVSSPSPPSSATAGARGSVYSKQQRANRQQVLSGSLRLEFLGRGPSAGFNGTFLFAADDVYSFDSTMQMDGEDVRLEVLIIGTDRYVRLSNVPNLGDRWIVNPLDIDTAFINHQLVDDLKVWDTFAPRFVASEAIDGIAADHFALSVTGKIAKADVWVDLNGLPRAISIERVPDAIPASAAADGGDVEDYRVFYNEPVEIVAPTNVVTEADLRAGL
jgi:hypothetical protein